MNWVDVTILGITGLSVLSGVIRGALKTVFSLAGVIVGFIVASRESGAVGIVLSRWFPEEIAAPAGFVFVFLGIATVFALTGWLARKLLASLFLGWVDRGLGAAVGFLRAGLFVGVLALVMEGLGPFAITRESRTYPYALDAGRLLLQLIPEETLRRLDWDAVREGLSEVPEVVDL